MSAQPTAASDARPMTADRPLNGSPVDLTPFRHLYPFRSRYARVNGWRCHYLDEGQGPPVLMLHGNPTWSFYYRRLVADLSADHRAVAPDHVGCGLSDKPPRRAYPYDLARRVDDLERLADRLGLDRDLTLIVHDWGGMIGLAFALRRPQAVRRLVITNTAGFFPPGGRRLPLRLRLLRRVRPLAEPAILGLNLFARAAMVMAAARRLPPDVRAGLLAPYDTPAHRVAVLRFVQDIPLRPGDPSYALVDHVDRHLHRLRDVPALICWGGRDFVFTPAYYHEWRRRLPEAACHYEPRAGHYLLEDAPAAVIGAIRTFLRDNPL